MRAFWQFIKNNGSISNHVGIKGEEKSGRTLFWIGMVDFAMSEAVADWNLSGLHSTLELQASAQSISAGHSCYSASLILIGSDMRVFGMKCLFG